MTYEQLLRNLRKKAHYKNRASALHAARTTVKKNKLTDQQRRTLYRSIFRKFPKAAQYASQRKRRPPKANPKQQTLPF
jgi:hypothetical protein